MEKLKAESWRGTRIRLRPCVRREGFGGRIAMRPYGL
jgi:hypothetical protein